MKIRIDGINVRNARLVARAKSWAGDASQGSTRCAAEGWMVLHLKDSISDEHRDRIVRQAESAGYMAEVVD